MSDDPPIDPEEVEDRMTGIMPKVFKRGSTVFPPQDLIPAHGSEVGPMQTVARLK